MQNFPEDVGTSASNAFLSALVKGMWKLVCRGSGWVINPNKIMMTCPALASSKSLCLILYSLWKIFLILNLIDWSRAPLSIGFDGPTKQIIKVNLWSWNINATKILYPWWMYQYQKAILRVWFLGPVLVPYIKSIVVSIRSIILLKGLTENVKWWHHLYMCPKCKGTNSTC